MRWVDHDVLRRQLTGLDEVRFAELCNAILSDVASRNGIGRECLSLNLKTKEPDGGIDARCSDASSIAGLLFPRPNVDYQYKSGRTDRSIPQIVREDILKKPRVLAGLREGHAFVYVAAWDRGDAISGDLVAELRELNVIVEPHQVIFVGGSTLVTILERTPALLSRFFGIGDTTVSSIQQWEAYRALTNPFQRDAKVESQLADLRRRIEAPASTVRIVGAAGDGKTRLVLEALRDSELRDSVLYAPQVDRVSSALKAYLRHSADVLCTLVVDEVDDAEAERLENDLAPRPQGVRLVLIGLDASGRAPRETLQVEGLSEPLLTAVIQSIAKGLDQERALEIAQDCQKSPKLAVFIATRIRDNPSLAIPELLTDGPVRNALDRYLSLDPSDPKWDAISTCALLMRVGWSGEFEEESTRLLEAVDLNVIAARRNVQDLHDRFGIAPEAGRFRYISPAILGDHLAARQLESWTRPQLTRLLGALTPSMADSFSRRARRLSAVLVNQAIVEEVILGDQGPFRELNDLEVGRMSMLVRHLAAPFPRATLNTLERIIGEASPAELSAAQRSRRDMVWALEQLLWPEATFERAARLLLKLAAAENETWTNNATGLWAETFQTQLGRTAAGWRARLRVVREAATSSDATQRRLALSAIRAAFRTGHISRMGMPPSDVPGMPAEAWRPTTYGEWWDSLVGYLDILAPLLQDHDSQVRIATSETMGELIGELFRLGPRVSARWIEIARELAPANYELRGPIINNIEAMADRWELRLSSPPDNAEMADERARQAIHELLGQLEIVRATLSRDDFQSRFRTVISRPLRRIGRSADLEAGDRQAREDMRTLAAEAIRSRKLLENEWGFLAAERGWWQSERWFEVLGEVDEQRVFADQIQLLSRGSARAIGWLSLYEIGQSRRWQGSGHIENRAEQMTNSDMPLHALDLLLRAGFAPGRVGAMQRLFNEQRVNGIEINRLAYTDWIQKLEPVASLSLLRSALKYVEFPEDVTPFAAGYLQAHADAEPAFRDEILRVLTGPARPEANHAEALSTYEWETLAKRYVDEMPIAIGAAVLEQLEAHVMAHDSGLIEILQRAWQAANRQQFFEVVLAPRLADRDVRAWKVRSAIEQLSLTEAGDEYLLGWVNQDPERRAILLAELLGAPTGTMSDLQAKLLERFGEYGVGSIYRANFSSGTWVGEHSNWIRSKIATAEQLASDERPIVREWAKGLLDSLKHELAWAESREAEERLEA